MGSPDDRRNQAEGAQVNETPLEALWIVVGLSSLTLIPFFMFLGMVAVGDWLNERRKDKS